MGCWWKKKQEITRNAEAFLETTATVLHTKGTDFGGMK